MCCDRKSRAACAHFAPRTLSYYCLLALHI